MRDFTEAVRALPVGPGWTLKVRQAPLAYVTELRLMHTDGRHEGLLLNDADLRDDLHACQQRIWAWIVEVTMVQTSVPARKTRKIDLED